MPLNVTLLVAGLILAGMVLKDVFDTVSCRAAAVRRLEWLTADRSGMSCRYGSGRAVGAAVSPPPLRHSSWSRPSLSGWRFGARIWPHGLCGARLFRPHLIHFSDAVYLAGSSLVTVGLSQANPQGSAGGDPRRGILRPRRHDHGGDLFAGSAVQHRAARHRHHQAQHVCGRAAVGADPARALRGPSQSGSAAPCPRRIARLVRNRPSKPQHPPFANLFPVDRHRCRLASSAGRTSISD